MPTSLTLDDAAHHLGIPRRQLSASLSVLGLKTTRGADRRAYVASSDVEAIRALRANEGKSNPMYGSGNITYANSPQPQQMPRNYKDYAKEAYAGDPTYYKSANYIITNGGAIPPKLYTDATMKTPIDTHPLLDKLEQPNPEQSGVDYRESVIGWQIIAGNSFQYAIRAGKGGPPDELWTLPPHLVHPVSQKPRGIIGYDFDQFDEQNKRIPPELICHLKFWNPNSEEFGLSPVEPVAILIDQNASARKWNLSTTQNNGRIPGVFTAPAPMDVNARTTLEKSVNGKYAGPANAGKYVVMDAGLGFTPTAYTPTELDWLESIRRNEGGIANTLNIPPQLIGDTSASTYNNMGEAKAASYTEEIFPVLDRIYAGWRRWLLPMYGLKGAYLYYDKESVEVVQQVIQAQKDAQFKRAVAAWMSGLLTMNMALEVCGLPPVSGGDVYRFGAIIVRSSELDKYAEQSLTTPAMPPMPQAEPLTEPPPGGNATNGAGKEPSPEPKPAPIKARFTPAEKSALHALRQKLRSAKRLAPATHKTWECAPGACSFCLENDGVTVPIDEDFPNGCSTPDDCHKFCKCSAWELALPDDIDTSDYSTGFLISVYARRFLESRHDRDVAAQQARTAVASDESDDESGDDLEYAKAQRRAERRMHREEYQRFMEAVR